MDFKNENDGLFLYDENNTIIKGWVNDNDLWYHMNDKSGALDLGWFQTATDQDRWFYSYIEDINENGTAIHTKGEMATGWIEVGDFYYYTYPDKVETSDKTFYKGEMATGWIRDTNNSDWYYLYPAATVNYGVSYPKGAMAVDWVKLGEKSKYYYLLKEKTEYNGNTHYKGACVANTTLNINGENYTFDSNGVWQQSTSTGDSLVSDSLVEYIGGWEVGTWNNTAAHAYEDPYYPGVQAYWTIGYGTCYCAIPSAFPNGLDSTCTQEQALSWLKQEVNLVANRIKEALGDNYSNISQQAFDCLCDIGYNAGTGSLIGGNTWNSIISGDENRITSALMSWNKANGVVSEGLTKRCKSRVNMCINGIYDSDH